jgi:competence protein ComEC
MIYAGAVIATAFWAGILAGDKLAVSLHIWAAGTVCLGIGFLLYLVKQKSLQNGSEQTGISVPVYIIAVGIACICCLGACRVQWASQSYENLPHHIAGAEVCMEGRIEEKGYSFVSEKGRMTRYVLSLDRYAYRDEGIFQNGSGNVYVTIPDRIAAPLHSSISYTGTMKAMTYYRNEGMYDSRHRDQEKNIFMKSYNDASDCIHLRQPPSGWQNIREQVRQRITTVFLTVLDDEGAHILSSLLFGGYYDELPPSILESFSITGLIHILSVSGSHVALVLAAVQTLGKVMKLRENHIFCLSLLFVFLYGALADFTAPVIRASVMGMICAYSLVARRDYTAVHALALAVIGMLMYSPYLAYDLSFRLSCGASAGIVLLQRQVSQWLSFLPSFLRDGCAVCICAQILLVPFLFFSFHAFPVYSLIANITVGPVLDMVILLGLAAAVTGSVFLPAGQAFLWIIKPLLMLAVKGNYFIAALPHSRFWSGALTFSSVCAWYLMVAAIFFLPRKRRVLSIAAVLLCLVQPVWEQLYRADVTVRVFDMGMDRATCAVYSDNSVYLWYNKSQWSNPEQVVSVLTPALRHAGVFRLSGCIVSGNNCDKTAAQVASQFPIDGGCSAAREEEPVIGGAIPYYVYMNELPEQFPEGTCLEIQSLRNVSQRSFPQDAAAVIIHGNTGQGDRYTEWLEYAEFYDIPWFSPAQNGEITGTYRQGIWTFKTYGGDMA